MKKFIVHPQYELVQDLNNGNNDNTWVIKIESITMFKKFGIGISFRLIEVGYIVWQFETYKDRDIFYQSLLDL